MSSPEYWLQLAKGVVIALFAFGTLWWLFSFDLVREVVVLLWRTRYSLLCLLLLLGFAPLASYGAPTLLRSLLIMDGPVQLGVMTWMSLMVATMIIVTFNVNRLNVEDRLGPAVQAGDRAPMAKRVYRPPLGHPWRSVWLLWLTFGLPLPIWAAIVSLRDGGPSWGAQPLSLIQVGGGLTLGFVAAILTLAVMACLQHIFLHPSVTSAALLPFEEIPWERCVGKVRWFYGLGNWFANLRMPGYFRVENGQTLLAPGHAQLVIVWCVLMVAYLAWYAITVVIRPTPESFSALPALAYALVIVLFAGFTLTGLAFFFDYHRVPTLGILALVVITSYTVFDADHYYELVPVVPSDDNPRPEPVALREVFDPAVWKFPAGPDGKRTLVVVTASGGGIQAASWTTRVLTGLDEKLTGISESVGLISGVSGGSVGSMYYLVHRGTRTNDPAKPMILADDVRRQINELARASSLEATAWGQAFPDLLRGVFPPLAAKTIDRGWALESTWRNRIADATADPQQRQKALNLRLRDWAPSMLKAEMPVVVFNSVLVETGQRFLISPVVIGDAVPSRVAEPVELFAMYPGADPLVATGVRLSATFSYVSPICRPLPPDAPAASDDQSDAQRRFGYHVADGGYTDNEGIVTAITWTGELIRHFTSARKPPPFDRVLFVRIFPFPEAKVAAPEPNSGIWHALAGPTMALANVRVSSQAERGDLETALAQEANRLRNEAQWQDTVRVGALAKAAKEAQSDPAVSEDKPLASLVDEISKIDPYVSAEVQTVRQSIAQEPVVGKMSQLASEARDDSADRLQQLASAIASVQGIEVYSVKFQFPSKSGIAADSDDYEIPLSWRLTEQQKQTIDSAWTQIDWATRSAEGSMELAPADLDRFFRSP